MYDNLNRLVQQGENTAKAVAASKVYLQNYYDNYDFVGDVGFTDNRFVDDTSGHAKGSLTGTVMNVFGSTEKIATMYHYDIKGRLTKTTENNLMGGYNKTVTTYTFTDQPATVTLTHTANGKLTQTEVYTYTYDKFGRIATKQLHGSSTNQLTYAYNIRSWLTDITSDKFTQNLGYDSNYNGNISTMDWTANGASHAYTFSYDGVNRMTDAIHGDSAYTEKVTEYDKNGNIKYLQRYNNGTLVDNLTYDYNGNQLTKVEDATGNTAGFNNGASTSNEYTYDNNGNLTKDLNKGITNISYNVLSLPQVVTFSNGSTITYLYTADGKKLRTVHVINGTTTTTDYCGNVIYENGGQKLLLTEEGYVDLSAPTPAYYYYLKDHQGNNRVVVSSSGTVAESNQYYPFGLLYANSNSNLQPYKYNGKELDTKAGLNWYDYGARHYDAALGRWHVVDPLAEKYYSSSPYIYCGNNSIKYVDPNGMFYDGYTIDEYGYLKKVNDEGGDKYDVLYNKSSYSEEKRREYDTTGDKIGIQISKGVIKDKAGERNNYSSLPIKSPIVDSEGHPTGKVQSAQSYEISSDAESLSIMNFLDKNTKVEWGNTLLSDSEGKTVNILVTSHEDNTVRFNGYFINKKKGYEVIRADHIHPRNTTSAASDNDRISARHILKSSPKAKFRVLHKGKYYNY